MLRAILFDLDGTLAHTDPLHFQIWQEMLRDYGLEIDEAFYKARISGGLNPLIIKQLLPHLSLEEGTKFAEDKEARFREMAYLLKPMAGLDKLLAWTDERNLKRVLVTNAPRKNVEFMLSALELTESFEKIILGEEAKAGKPDPAAYQLAVSYLNISAEETIAFEDSTSGVRSAVGAGIRTIGIASTQEPEVLYQLGAWKVIPDFTDSFLWNFLEEEMGVTSNGDRVGCVNEV